MTDARTTARWRLAAWSAAAVMVFVLAYGLMRIPVQVTDSLIVMLQAQAAPSAWIGYFVGEEGFLRPVYWIQTRLLLDASAGQHYYAVFRLFHVLLVAALFALVVIVARVRSRGDFAAFAFALVVIAGHQTFRGNVWEAYPINHYLEIAVCSLAALALAQSRGGWWADALAALLFLAATLTLESGLLVWVVLVAARLTGLRGVSWRGVALVTVLVAGYFYLRMAHLGTGMPGLDERAVGFGLGRLDRDEVVARFAAQPYVLYAYNVAASVLSILLSEPRSGTFVAARRWLTGDMNPAVVVSLLSSLLTTGLLCWYGATRVREWLARRFDNGDRLVLVFAAVLAANAGISYAYTKDEVMSTAGLFYGLAAYAAVRAALARALASSSVLTAGVLAGVLCVGSALWAVRATGLHYHMHYAAYYTRNEWIDVDAWLRAQHAVPADAEAVALIGTLRESAIGMPMVHPYFLPRWSERWFEVE